MLISYKENLERKQTRHRFQEFKEKNLGRVGRREKTVSIKRNLANFRTFTHRNTVDKVVSENVFGTIF